MIKKLVLLFFVLSFSSLLQSQTLYWVGGSGYWNDIGHWSYTSGGSPAGIAPGPAANVVFDDLSAVSGATIHILQNAELNSMTALNTNFNIDIVGSPNVDVKWHGSIALNPYLALKLNGRLYLDPASAATYQFSHNKLNNDIFIKSNTSVELGVFETSGNMSFSGNMALKNSTIFAGKMFLTNTNISLESASLYARNALGLSNYTLAADAQHPSKIVTKKQLLSAADISYLGNITGLKLSPASPCSPTFQVVSPTCTGACDGKIIVNLSGCSDPPFDLSLITGSCSTPPASASGVGATTFTFSGICACTAQYAVGITNNIGESGGGAVAVGDPPPTNLSFVIINQPSCFGLCNGQIKVIPSFLTAKPLTLVWSNGTVHTGVNGIDTLKNVCAGPLTVTVTNVNGCVNTFTTSMTQPALLLANGTQTNINCNGACTGAASVSPTGGTAGYTVHWSNSLNTPGVTNLCTGPITATVTDTKGCTATYSANIVQPPAATLTVNQVNMSCASSCNGSATVTATGGTAPFTYAWSAPAVSTGSVATGLCAGTYSVNVTDALNCLKTITLTITSPPTLTTTPTGTNVACHGVCIGAINVNASGGTPNYTYTWSPAVSSGSTAVGLCAGAYNYTVTDALGCQTSKTYTITEPPLISLGITKTDVTCNGACDGTATVTPTGGVLPFTYTWSPVPPVGQGTSSISSLCPGTYTVNTLDNNNCPNTATVSITQPQPIAINATSVSPVCNGICNGSISSAPTGGVGPYTFTLQTSGGPVTGSPPFTNLCAGVYTLTVQDSRNCVKTQVINLTQPNPITLALNATPINCFGQCNSTISSVVNGGTPTYTFSWSNGAVSASLVNQCVGVYSSTVTDAGGCTATATVNVTSPPAITVAITPTNVVCNGQCNGAATAVASGGTPNYSYSWTPTGDLTPISSGLCAGNYTVSITDNAGCIQTQTTTITAPPSLTLVTTTGSVSCAGSCDGSVSVTASGGTPNYSYSWSTSPVQTTSVTLNNLCPGNYAVTVTDSKGCISSRGTVVTQPAILTGSISNVQSSCNICIGSATGNGAGGTPPYSYSWANSSGVVTNTTQVATNMCVGDYTLTISDSKGCTTTQTVTIAQTVLVVVTNNGNTLQCNGGCTGIAMANASGGTGTYTYTWSPAPLQNTQTATGLCAGIHTVMVQDQLGCSNSGTVSFASPPAVTLTVNQTNVTCNGLCNGSATANASGGTGSLSYQWLPGGQTTPGISGLCAGTYTLNVTDGNNCIQTQTVTITQPSQISATFNAISPSTCVSNDGSITISPSGGTTPYTFTWTPGGSVNPLTNLSAGGYSVIVSDANGCQQTLFTTLNTPNGPTITVTSNSIACFGQCTGSSTVSAVGSGPFTYTWSAGGAINNPVNTGMCAGNYVVQVKDNNSCITSQTLAIAQPSLFTLAGVATNAGCNGVCSGSINLTPAGGTLPYSYTWTPAGGNVPSPTGLCANNYTVNVADGNGCPATATFVITQPSSLTLVFTKKDVLCNGGCTGGARGLISGGNGPYTYQWAPNGSFPGSTLDTIVNLCSGTYSLAVTDMTGCTVSGTVSIGQPPVLTSTLTSQNVKCNGQCNGSATINAVGGTAPYTYLWNSPVPNTIQSVSGLCQGSYIGTVSDANGCSDTHSFVITQPAPILVNTTPSNPKCNAVCNGSVATTVSGGNPAYHYQWIPAGGTVQNPTGLCAGIYTVIVTDDSLCTGQDILTLTDPNLLLANASFTNPTCVGGCDGVATSNPVGGTLPYTYSWVAPPQSTQTISGLCAGNYTVTVSDANACVSSQSITLLPPVGLVVNPAVSPATCGLSDGSITAVVASGNGSYTYNWLPPVPLAQSTNSVVTGLGAGVYTVVVMDASACSVTVAIPLSNSNGPSGATITSTNVICHGQCNGAASISNPVGGTPSYTLAWINPVSTNTLITGLCPGSYTAQITDANNCILFMPATITEPQVIDDNEAISSAICFGNCNGSISVNPTGGNGGYTYSWSNAASTQSISSLCPGNYSLTITDALNCTLTANYNLPSSITITTNTFATNPTCFGNCNGTLAAVNVAGGLPPYMYTWTDPIGQTGSVATGLCSGTYSVTITDANGCFDVLPGAVVAPLPISPNPTIADPSCGLCNGAATIAPSGGNGGAYNAVWSNTQTGLNVTNLCAGVYGVLLTDNAGCTTNTNVVVNSSSGITSETVTKADETCFATCDGTVTVTAVGGTAPIAYHWVHNNATTPSLTGLCSGTYYCNMTDANGCQRTASVVIGAAASLTLQPTVIQTQCNSNTGSIAVVVTGGAMPYTYSWLPAGNTAAITNLVAGTYTLTVSDANGCSKTQVFAINSINGPVIALSSTDIHCSTACSGTASLSISGGVAPYAINWSTGASTPTVGALCTGAYTVSVTDNLGCVAAQSFSISNSQPIVFSAPDLDNPKCNNDCNGAITALPSGGTLPFMFSWTPVAGSAPALTNLCANAYSLTVTDAQGCTATDSYTLTNPPALGLVAAVTNPTCSATPSGTIDITVSGGTPAYTYTWTGATNASTQDLNTIFVGTYSLHVTDAGGCSKDTSIVLTSTLNVIALAGNDTTFCKGGTFQLNGSNSTGGTTYQWVQLPGNIPVSNTNTATVMPATGTSTYVLIADAGTCIDMDTVLITSNALPSVDAGPDVSIPLFTSTPIGGSPTGPGTGTFTWTPSYGLDNPASANPTASNTVTTQYTVTVTDANGCMNSDTVTVFIYPQIKIPNGFSPNSDGKNDMWVIDNIQQFPDCVVEVYNRWGEQLFYSKGYNPAWDGHFKGKDLPVGTYYYIIDLHHPSYPNAYTGPLTIFR